MHTGLERVLMCYVIYRPDVGYVQVRDRLLLCSARVRARSMWRIKILFFDFFVILGHELFSCNLIIIYGWIRSLQMYGKSVGEKVSILVVYLCLLINLYLNLLSMYVYLWFILFMLQIFIDIICIFIFV